MQSFQIATGPSTGQKNYVFVDEHNRHKRLKVMRACEGCRRRKIKCDSATTNIWPCSACTRLKLTCVPPATIDSDLSESDQLGDADLSAEPVDTAPGETDEDVKPFDTSQRLTASSSYLDYQETTPNFSQPHILQKSFLQVDSYNSEPLPNFNVSTSSDQIFEQGVQSYPPPQSIPNLYRIDTASTSHTEQSDAEEISEQLGELKITETGIAQYARQQVSNEAEPEAPIQEQEDNLPPLRTVAGSQIRIPPELMPPDDEALRSFNAFFEEIHPYFPVLNRSFFYNQWQSERSAISPLLLEAIFACAGRLMDQPAGGSQWLALANRHEESFLDKPRLSTLQALLLLLKAREGIPKRGYYYRSWMTCKTIVSMAKDLDLHEHFDIHQSGEHCGSDSVECLMKTRVWQTLLVCEMMIGGPQGRSDMGVDPKTVDVSPNPHGSDTDEFEAKISRQFAYFVRNARNIRLITDSSQKLKKKKDWGLDPEFVSYNVAFNKWPGELPPEFQVSLAIDGSPPQLASHFVGNMHTHYQLGVVMLHRPQLVASKSFANDVAWRKEMSLCYNSAKTLCRLQEAILQQYGPAGLLCMVRGINFTVYTILTCTMLHLIALASPDPEYNTDAREYFTRHMRVLEQCRSWAMPETQEQINALRSAFSEDINKPFELKSPFPVGSPSDQSRSSISPPREQQAQRLQIPTNSQYTPSQRHNSAPAYFITSPTSAQDPKPDPSPIQQSYVPDVTAYPQLAAASYNHPATQIDASNWNPTPIINQFNVAFSIPQSALAPPPPTASYVSVPRQGSFSFEAPGFTQSGYTFSQSYAQAQLPEYTQPQSHPFPPHQPLRQAQFSQQMPQYSVPVQPMQNSSVPEPTYVSARDWQQSVATVLDSGGLKRRWNFGHHPADEKVQKRMR